MQKISYVIPCYRSQHTVGGVVAEIAATMQTLPQYDYEVILVNDCSPDDTFGTIRGLVAADSHVVGVDLAKNFGQHAALMAGFHKCSGDIVVCLDDDGQTPADEVGKLLAKIDEGYDVVYASYDTKRQAGWRNLGSWVNSKMTEIMLGKPPELVVNSYFAARRFIVDEMLRYEHCYPYVIGLVLRSTKRICNVPVHHRAREEGRSGYTLSTLLNLWMNGFTSFSVKPLRIATYIGTLFAVAGFLYFIYIIIDHFTRAAAPIGWASTTALLLLLGGMILVVLGIMGEYVGRIYMCAPICRARGHPAWGERRMKQAKWFLLLHVILGIYAGSSVCSKLAAQQPFLSAAFIVLYGLMLLALVTYAVGWQQVIKHLPLTTAYANKAVTVVWGILLGLAVFGEAVTPRQVIGAVIIICGIVLFVRADNEGEGGK